MDRLDEMQHLLNIMESSLSEKAVSKAQQRFMGMVHAAHKGEKPASAKVAKVAKDMSKSDAEDYASTKHKGLPNKKKTTEGAASPYLVTVRVEQEKKLTVYAVTDDEAREKAERKGYEVLDVQYKDIDDYEHYDELEEAKGDIRKALAVLATAAAAYGMADEVKDFGAELMQNIEAAKSAQPHPGRPDPVTPGNLVPGSDRIMRRPVSESLEDDMLRGDTATFTQTKHVGDGTVSITASGKDLSEIQDLLKLAGVHGDAQVIAPNQFEPEPCDIPPDDDGEAGCEHPDVMGMGYSVDKDAIQKVLSAKLGAFRS